MKLDWKKADKEFYFPKAEPTPVTVPEFGFFAVDGRGDPNGAEFGRLVETLYALSYAVKMSPKSGRAPEGYAEYSVFPLEGFWDIAEEARANFTRLDKNSLVYTIMIRQPDFVTADYARGVLEAVAAKKPNFPMASARFMRAEEGACVQMLHLGPFDMESGSFERMESFCAANGLRRVSKRHREIYLSDARRTAPEKMKTVLRFGVVPA